MTYKVTPDYVSIAGTATQVFTLTGSIFNSETTVKLIGQGGTEYNVVSPTVTSPDEDGNSTSITFKLGDLTAADSTISISENPYKIKVSNVSEPDPSQFILVWV